MMQQGKKYAVLALGFLLSLMLSFYELHGQVKGTQANIMGSFIYHFTNYISWPEPDTTHEFKILILDNNELAQSLEQISELREVNGKEIVVQQIGNLDEFVHCQILFIGDDAQVKPQVLDQLMLDYHTVIIGNCQGCLKRGLSINFVTKEENIRFEINKTKLEENNLRVSSQLLKLAYRVN
jgi:hypothetical protein